MTTKGEKVTLWHSLLNPQKNTQEWYQSILEKGIQPSGGEYLRENCVYFHKPDESVYDPEILDQPALKVEVPESMVHATNLSYCSTEDGFDAELWEDKLTPYSEFEPEGAAEYVVVDGLDPEFVQEFYPEGPPHEAGTETEGWKNQKIAESDIDTAAELFS